MIPFLLLVAPISINAQSYTERIWGFTIRHNEVGTSVVVEYMHLLTEKQKSIDMHEYGAHEKEARDVYLSLRKASGIESVINGIIQNDVFAHNNDTLYLIEQVTDYTLAACSYVWGRNCCYAISYYNYRNIKCVPYKRHIQDSVSCNNQDPEYLLEKYLEIDPIEMTMDLVEHWNKDSIQYYSGHIYDDTLKMCLCPLDKEFYLVSRIIVKNISTVEIETMPLCAINWHPEIDGQWIIETQLKAFDAFMKKDER